MHKLKEVHIDGERYISDEIMNRVAWLQHRSEEIYHGEPDRNVALTKLYQIIGMISLETN